MEQYAVFLRGINVGGNNPVKMAVLKNALMNKQFMNVKTYINSGNLVFGYKGDRQKAKGIIAEMIRSLFSITVDMIIKTREETEQIIRNDPFDREKENDNAKKVIILLSDKLDQEKALLFKNDKNIEENYYCGDDLLYIYYHNGAGRSKFTTTYIERKLKLVTTGRNWNTLLKVNELLKEE